MRALSILFIATLLGVVPVSAAPPNIPRTNEVVRYEREQPVFQSQQISKERGDALLSLLDGGQAVDDWMKDVPLGKYLCVLPVPPNLWMNIILTNGMTYRIAISDDGLLNLPDGLYTLTNEPSRQALKDWMAEMESDFRHEVVSAPKPLLYTVGTVDDGGTLSGIARLFYGDASKWRKIYEANRQAIKNPDVIDGRMKLTIPKL